MKGQGYLYDKRMMTNFEFNRGITKIILSIFVTSVRHREFPELSASVRAVVDKVMINNNEIYM